MHIPVCTQCTGLWSFWVSGNIHVHVYIHVLSYTFNCSSSGRHYIRPARKTTAVSAVSLPGLDAQRPRSQKMTCMHVKSLFSRCSRVTLWQWPVKKLALKVHVHVHVVYTRSCTWLTRKNVLSNLAPGPDPGQSFLNDVAKKAVKEFTVIPEPDGVRSYARVLCHLRP